MAYIAQNFIVGQKLTAEALNRMDQQIAQNAEGVESFNRQMVVDELKTLNLETDGQYLVLKLGDTAIAEVAIADVSNVIPCTDLTVTSPSILQLDIGETDTITYEIQPADSNQIVRFRSEDIGVVNVTSAGVATGIGAGISNIHVLCGTHAESVQAIVSTLVKPTWMAGNGIYVDSTDKHNNTAAKLEQSSTRLACVFPQEGTDNIFVKAGQKVTVTYNGTANYFFMNAYAIAPETEEGFSYTEDWSGRICAAKCRTVANIFGDTTGHQSPIEYTATEDCYIIFTFRSEDDPDENYTQTELDALNSGLITVRISPN